MRFTFEDFQRHFTKSEMRPAQTTIGRGITKDGRSYGVEAPTGSGKTDVGLTTCIVSGRRGLAIIDDGGALRMPRPCFYVAPTLALVNQTAAQHPGAHIVYGRGQYPCPYYHARGKPMTAGEVPCAMLCTAHACPHQVDQTTGTTREDGAERCPYFDAKWRAKSSGGVVVVTTAFFLMSTAFAGDWEVPEVVVIDEAHQIADIARGLFKTEITDWHLRRITRLLKRIGDAHNRRVIGAFLIRFRRIARRRRSDPTLLTQDDTRALIDILRQADQKALATNLATAVGAGVIDVVEDAGDLKILQDLVHDLMRYVRRMEYALEREDHPPLSFVFAYYHHGDLEGRFARYHLVIQSYYVAPLIKRVVGEHALVMSATIGRGDVFAWETGLDVPIVRVTESPFPVGNRRLYVPADAPDLAFRARSKHTLRDAIKGMVATALRFAEHGHRSLLIVVSEEERQKVITRASRDGLDVVTYGNGMNAREAIAAFQAGQGTTLLGTEAQYGQGVDLPDQRAPIIIVLRPGYPNPHDPQAQFEVERYGGRVWAVREWRVGVKAIQAAGRNIRGPADKGVTIFWSAQFRKVVTAALPAWLEPAYSTTKPLAQVIEESLDLLGRSRGRRTRAAGT